MDKIYSIVALRMRVFFSLSNNVLPYNRFCDKEDLVNSNNFAINIIQGAQDGVPFIIKCRTVEKKMLGRFDI